MDRQSPLTARLSAETQCDWVDRTLDAAQSRLTANQTNVLVRASTGQHMRRGIALAAVPRGAAAGLTCGRYPTTMVRDVVVALAHVLVDDQIVGPMVRMGRRLPNRHRAHPERPQSAPRAAPAHEKALVLVWATGKAVLAAPLNALVVGLGAAGATLGAVMGALFGVAVALCAPRGYVTALGRGFAALYHNAAIEQLAATELLGTSAQTCAASQASHQLALQALCREGEGDACARAASQALSAHPSLSRAAGLGPWVGVDAAALLGRSHARADAAARVRAQPGPVKPQADKPPEPPPHRAVWPMASPLSPTVSDGSDLGDFDA